MRVRRFLRFVVTNLISTSQPTAFAYFARVATEGECLPAASRRDTALLVVPMQAATSSRVRPASPARTVSSQGTVVVLLPRHGDSQAFFGSDQMIVVICAQIELNPVDDAVELARLGRIVIADT